jgi:CheY-like chemotaxis protein
LAISRELSKLLGGEIRLISSPGEGSIFTLYLPRTYTPLRNIRKQTVNERAIEAGENVVHIHHLRGLPAANREIEVAPAELVNEANDDRDSITQGDPVLLIVENDAGFAQILLESAREQGFKGLVTSLGAGALALSHEYKPAAITLDMFLPDMQGWRVLDRLKHDNLVRHIPVCVISTDDARERALASDAIGFIGKPMQSRSILDDALNTLYQYVSRGQHSLLVIMADSAERAQLLQYIGGDDIELVVAGTLEDAWQMVRERQFDCIVLSQRDIAIDPEQLLDNTVNWSQLGPLPLIFYRRDIVPLDHATWSAYKDSFTLRDAHSLPRLLDLTVSLLHRATLNIPETQRAELEDLRESDRPLAKRKALIVDDDMRNIFALATVLEEHGMLHVRAENGRDAIRLIETDPTIDIVLMDIMMPEMDGMQTMQEIRKLPAGRDLPMIAVTAKAMKGDREKCIEAGAWDYLSKPVNTNDLLTVLRAWLHR